MVNLIRGGPDDSSSQFFPIAIPRRNIIPVSDKTSSNDSIEDEKVALAESLTTALNTLRKERLTK